MSPFDAPNVLHHVMGTVAPFNETGKALMGG